MKIKILLLIVFLVSAIGFINLSNSATAQNPITRTIDFVSNFFGKNVVLATGIDYRTGKPVVLNPISGEAVKSCYSLNTQSNNTCKAQLLSDGALWVGVPQEIASALDMSNKVFEGTIQKNGKNIPARFLVSVSALYQGSMCHTYISGGEQWETCSTLQDDCALVLPLSIYGKKNETGRRKVRDTCMQFVTAWKKPDCKQLHPVYRLTATGYSLAYKRYVYDTCKSVPQTPTLNWGGRP